jgi:hypothetical protein
MLEERLPFAGGRPELEARGRLMRSWHAGVPVVRFSSR